MWLSLSSGVLITGSSVRFSTTTFILQSQIQSNGRSMSHLLKHPRFISASCYLVLVMSLHRVSWVRLPDFKSFNLLYAFSFTWSSQTWWPRAHFTTKKQTSYKLDFSDLSWAILLKKVSNSHFQHFLQLNLPTNLLNLNLNSNLLPSHVCYPLFVTKVLSQRPNTRYVQWCVVYV